MNISEIPWNDQPGFWSKRISIDSAGRDGIDLEVGGRFKKDGTIKFKINIRPSAIVPDAQAALAIRTEYDSLQAAKEACEDIATRIDCGVVP